MEKYIKNIDHGTVLKLTDLVDIQPGQVVSRTLAQNEAVSVTLFAFDKGEEISTHDSTGDAMVSVLEGTGRFTVGGVPHIVKDGETLGHACQGTSCCLWGGSLQVDSDSGFSGRVQPVARSKV